MPVIFNGTTRQIEITDSSIFSLDAEQDLYSEWKRWSQLSDNSKYAVAFSVSSVFGGNPTVEGQAAPKYFFLTNFWQVLIDNGNVVSVGLNLYTENFTTPYVVGSGGVSDRNSDAVSVNSEAIEFSSFEGAVTIDKYNITGFASSGTEFPTGTRQKPCNNTTDALAIAQFRGLSVINVIGNLEMGLGDNFQRFEFKGESPLKSIITVLSDANVINCEFYDCNVTGILDGNSQIENSVITGLDFVDGYIFRCAIGPASIKLGTSTNANIFSCYSTVPGSLTPEINMNGTGVLALRDYTGGIALSNYNGSDSHSVDLNSGQVILKSTVTSGDFTFRGTGKLVDESMNHIHTGIWNGGVNVKNELVNTETVAESVWDKDISGYSIEGQAGYELKIARLQAALAAALSL